MLLAYYFRL